jgi:hypothetical protein
VYVVELGRCARGIASELLPKLLQNNLGRGAAIHFFVDFVSNDESLPGIAEVKSEDGLRPGTIGRILR